MLRFALLCLALLCLPCGNGALAADDPTLTIQAGDHVHVYRRSELLRRPDVETIQVPRDPAYGGHPMTYRAVKAATLFQGVPLAGDVVVEFRCLDGFSAPLNKDRLLDSRTDRATAYVAIEPAAKPWPALKPGQPSAGPFYLIWKNPEASAIGQEEWPYQLAAFAVKGSLRSLYPKVFPGADANAQVQRGFAVFTKTCFACHTMNKQGAAQLGPDLNVPYGPTEYMTAVALRRLVRNPQELRFFPKGQMNAFPPEALPDRDLDDVVAYLTYMAQHR